MPEARKPQAHWYVIQVRTNAETGMCRQIERACREYDEKADDAAGRVGLSECFSPRFKTQRKWKGEWQDVELPMLPGYVIADAENPAQLAAAIGNIRDLCKLLFAGETYAPLDDGERMWIDRQTHKGDRVIPMSFASKVGDRLEAVEGPLKGYEGAIVKVDRQNSLAHLEFHVGQITIKTKVGLGILPN